MDPGEAETLDPKQGSQRVPDCRRRRKDATVVCGSTLSATEERRHKAAPVFAEKTNESAG